MKFFTAVKQAIFASKAFAAAGIDFDKVSEAGDENVIKAHVDAAISSAIAKGHSEHEKLFAQAKAENDKLTADLTAISGNLTKAFEVLGVNAKDCADEHGAISVKKLEAAHEQIVTKAARQMLSASGQPPIPETPSADATKSGKKSASYAEFSAMSPKAKKEFLRAGGEIHDGPKL